MMELTTMEVHGVIDGLIRSDMIYIKPQDNHYQANIYTRTIPADIDEEELHDYKMMELDAILNYIFAVWDDRYEEHYGPYPLYAEIIRDFVIDYIQVVFHTPVWEAE